jgi:hypothetical protein
LSRIPPLSNMVGHVDDHDTRQPGHRKKLTGMTQSAHSNGSGLALWFPDREKIIGVRPVCPQVLSQVSPRPQVLSQVSCPQVSPVDSASSKPQVIELSGTGT